MSDRGDQEPLADELEKAREKLQKLCLKVRAYADGSSPGVSHTRRDSRPSSEDVSLDEVRNKLSSINNYFREKMAGRDAEPPVVHERQHAPEIAEPVRKKTKPPKPAAMPTMTTLKPSSFPGSSSHKSELSLGIGLDLGTSSIVASREGHFDSISSRSNRNAFLYVRSDEVTAELLDRMGMKYAITSNEKLHVLGDMAIELSRVFNREVQRPMHCGILNPSELQTLPMIKLLVKSVLWKPRSEDEVCCFSIPGKILGSDSDTIYHRGIFERILTDLGFRTAVIDEGYAVVLSELADKDFTGIGISCGAGLVNVCAAFKSIPVMSFSIERGGDWIDKNAASALGMVANAIMGIKENGVNLTHPATREEEAIAIYYRSYIQHFLESVAHVFSSGSNAPQFTKPVDIVFAGGSCRAINFIDVVKEEIRKISLGFPVGEIRMAGEPLLSVSRGCLFHAMNAVHKR